MLPLLARAQSQQNYHAISDSSAVSAEGVQRREGVRGQKDGSVFRERYEACLDVGREIGPHNVSARHGEGSPGNLHKARFVGGNDHLLLYVASES